MTDTQNVVTILLSGLLTGAGGTTLFNFVKENFGTKLAEKHKLELAQQQLYNKFREPIVLSSRELCFRLNSMLGSYPADYVRLENLPITDGELEVSAVYSTEFNCYKFVSSVYRVCALLARFELYRQEVTFLRRSVSTLLGDIKQIDDLEITIDAIRECLASTHLNRTRWDDQPDPLIYREQQRAIGEAMLEGDATNKRVIGYGKFCKKYSDKSDTDRNWYKLVESFLLVKNCYNLSFRELRLQYLAHNILLLIKQLDESKLEYSGDLGPATFEPWHSKMRQHISNYEQLHSRP